MAVTQPSRSPALTVTHRSGSRPSSQWDMDEQLLPVRRYRWYLSGWRQQISDLAQMFRVLPLGVVDVVELPDHLGEVGLAAEQLPGDDAAGLGQRRDSQVLAGQHRLGLDQLL